MYDFFLFCFCFVLFQFIWIKLFPFTCFRSPVLTPKDVQVLNLSFVHSSVLSELFRLPLLLVQYADYQVKSFKNFLKHPQGKGEKMTSHEFSLGRNEKLFSYTVLLCICYELQCVQVGRYELG